MQLFENIWRAAASLEIGHQQPCERRWWVAAISVNSLQAS